MDTEAIDDNERRRLLAIVFESDEAIADAQDSPDPVAMRVAVQARRKKGLALQGLGRFGEAIVEWDELLAISDLRLYDAVGTAGDAELAAYTLAGKVAALRELGRIDELVTATTELVDRFGSVPEAAGHAAAACRWAPFARSAPMADRVERAAAAIGPINRARRRLHQATLVADTLLARIGDSSDERLQKIAARAHLHRAMALCGLGEFGAGFREHENLISSNASGAAAKFQRMADINGRQPFLLLRLGQVADLKSRAYALGRGDEAIARVAYDDSVDALPTTDWQSRLVRLVAGWFRSRGGAEIVVPDHPPEP